MPEFLVELYVSRAEAASTGPCAEQARRAAQELSNQGTSVRYLRSIFVPEDETCFHLYNASSAAAVRAVASRAGLRFERISEAVTELCEGQGLKAHNESTNGEVVINLATGLEDPERGTVALPTVTQGVARGTEAPRPSSTE